MLVDHDQCLTLPHNGVALAWTYRLRPCSSHKQLLCPMHAGDPDIAKPHTYIVGERPENILLRCFHSRWLRRYSPPRNPYLSRIQAWFDLHLPCEVLALPKWHHDRNKVIGYSIGRDSNPRGKWPVVCLVFGTRKTGTKTARFRQYKMRAAVSTYASAHVHVHRGARTLRQLGAPMWRPA